MPGERMARPVRFLPNHLRHKARGTPAKGRGRAANGLMLRGVVTATYLPDDPTEVTRAAVRGFLPGSEKGILCDVLITDPAYRTLLRDVPIMVASGGLNDHEVWLPRESTIDITPGILNVSLEGQLIPPSQTHKMDGDHVVVAFLGNDLNQPIIVGQIPHPSTNRRPSFLDQANPLFNGPFKWRRFIQGIDFGVNRSGNIFVDMSNASTGLTDPIGTEIPAPGPDPLGGNLTITCFTGTLPVDTKVSIVDSVLTAPEPMILGDTWLTDTNTDLTQLNSHLTTLSAALTEISVNFAGLGLPTVAVGAAIAGITALQAYIATRQGFITTAQAVGLPYLSSHLEAD